MTLCTCVQINRPRGGTIFHQLSRLPSTHRSASALRAHPVSRRTLNHGSVRLLRQSVSIPPPRPPSPARRANPRPRTPRGSHAKAGCARQHARSLTGGVNGFHARPSSRGRRARSASRRAAARAAPPARSSHESTARYEPVERRATLAPCGSPRVARRRRATLLAFQPRYFFQIKPASRSRRETDEPIPDRPESIQPRGRGRHRR